MIRFYGICQVCTGVQGPVEAVKHVRLTIEHGALFVHYRLFPCGKVFLISRHQALGMP